MPHGDFSFEGKGLSFWWLSVWTTFVTIITIGIFYPWAVTAQLKWTAARTKIDGKQLTFKGSGAGFIGTWLLILFLSIITLGIYAPWAHCRFMRWQINNLYFADPGDVEKF